MEGTTMTNKSMNNLKNWLNGIDIDEKCFSYLKGELQENYSFELIRDLLALPCMEHRSENKLLLLIALLEDKEVNDTIIDILCQLLSSISSELWQATKGQLTDIIMNNYHTFSRSQILLLANTIEFMYAKGYEDTFSLSKLIYQRIPLYDNGFNSDSDDNVRIKLAKIAYSTCKNNVYDMLASIEAIKSHLKSSGRKYMLGTINYYKGLCLGVCAHKIDYKDANHYLLKSKNKGFALAGIYLSHRAFNFETSSECLKTR